MDAIRERLLAAEDDFLTAMAVGGVELEVFSERWTALQDDIDNAIACSAMDDDTEALASFVASRLDVIASSFQDILTATASLEASMEDELEDMFSRLIVGGADETATETHSTVSGKITTLPLGGIFNVQHPQSPASSCPNSPVPSLVPGSSSDDSDSDNEDDWVSDVSSNRKRYHAAGPTDYHDIERGVKRRRPDPPTIVSSLNWSHGNDCESGSPCAREVDGVVPTPRNIKPLPSRRATAPPISCPPSHSNQSRKRRLSDVSADRCAKRPRDLRGGPQRQTVSNPLPPSHSDIEDQTYNIDDWSLIFSIAEPATYAPLDPSIPVEIDYTGWSSKSAVEPVKYSFADSPFDAISEDLSPTEGCVADINSADLLNAVHDVVPAADATLGGHSSFGLASFVSPVEPISRLVRLAVSASTESNPPCPQPLPYESVSAVQDSYIPEALPHTTEYGAEADPNRSRSPSPLGSPPPSFENAIAESSLDWSPPRYSIVDQNPQTDCDYPPPPYSVSSEEKVSYTHGTTLDAEAILREIIIPDFTRKSGLSQDFLCAPIPLADLAIATCVF